MPDSRRVTTIERRLGFKWIRGMSRSKGESCKIRIIKALIDDIDDAKHKWVHIAPKKLRNHSNFEHHCLTLYDKHAHRIWPPPPADRSAWLVDAEFNDWDGEYPRNLSIDHHDDTLRDLFISLIFEKCVRYHENQKQDERRQLKMSINDDTSELSPVPESGFGGSLNIQQYQRSAETSSSTAGAQSIFDSDATTSVRMNESVCAMGAPVARMLPHASASVRGSGSYAGVRRISLDDSDSESMISSPSEPVNGTSSTQSRIEEQQQYDIAETNDYVKNRATTARKRPAPDYFEDGSSSKKSPRKGTARVKVRYLSRDSSSRTRLLASFELMPKTLATILQSAPRGRSAFCRSTARESDHSATNLSKATSKPSNGLHFQPGAKESTATGRLKSRLAATTSSSAHKAQPSLKSVATNDSGSTIQVPTPQPGDNEKSTLTQHESNYKPKQPKFIKLNAPRTTPGPSEKQLPATAKASSQGTAQIMVRPPEPESSAAGVGGSLYDFVASSDDSHEVQSRAGYKASDGSPGVEIGRNSATPMEKVVHATKDVGSLQSQGANISTSRNAYVEDEPEAEDASKLIAQNHLNDGPRGTFGLPSLPDNCAKSRDDEYQASSLANELQTKAQPYEELANLSMKSTLEMPAELKAKMEAFAASTQLPPTNPAGEQTTSTEVPQLKQHPIQEPSPKKLFIQLSTSEANVQQFVVVNFDFRVEELFERVQKRMNERVGNQVIKFLQIRLPTQSTDEAPYRVQKDDPDTWEWFLDMAREVEGSKIKVSADVEL